MANHAFGVADGVSLCSVVSNIRQDYKILTHKVLIRQAEAVKDKIIPLDFTPNKEAMLSNINARKDAESFLKKDGVNRDISIWANSNKGKFEIKKQKLMMGIGNSLCQN